MMMMRVLSKEEIYRLAVECQDLTWGFDYEKFAALLFETARVTQRVADETIGG